MPAILKDGFSKKPVRHPQFTLTSLSLSLTELTARPPLVWYTTCRIYLSHLLDHIIDLSNRLNENARDPESSLSLRYSTIFSLTTLAQISHTLARGRPTASALRDQRNDALRRVLFHLDELSPHDFRSLDPFISVSFFLTYSAFNKMTTSIRFIGLMLWNFSHKKSHHPSLRTLTRRRERYALASALAKSGPISRHPSRSRNSTLKPMSQGWPC